MNKLLGGRWEYVWIGEFGEMDNFRWNNLNISGITVLLQLGYATALKQQLQVEQVQHIRYTGASTDRLR
jgi:hypothetical protein